MITYGIVFYFKVELEDMPQEEIQPGSIPEEPKMRSEARGLCAWYLYSIYSIFCIVYTQFTRDCLKINHFQHFVHLIIYFVSGVPKETPTFA